MPQVLADSMASADDSSEEEIVIDGQDCVHYFHMLLGYAIRAMATFNPVVYAMIAPWQHDLAEDCIRMGLALEFDTLSREVRLLFAHGTVEIGFKDEEVWKLWYAANREAEGMEWPARRVNQNTEAKYDYTCWNNVIIEHLGLHNLPIERDPVRTSGSRSDPELADSRRLHP
ncbi:hypothetical protein KIPB_006368 [Kipferlia bialata]|uniref:Uncharacterized protein n=1 Tax=Kipferlia bialata TaxID=797122 RepID=A0A9K3CWX6_9EUKA|nr:hypothetical protein KIPB_006368 [Kipferlia bialata]|eukprot:g6368.t1